MNRLLVGAAVVALALLAPRRAAAQKLQMQSVYVHVTNSSGEPITDLAPNDFVVNHGGVPANIVGAKFGGDPMRVLLLVDSSDTITKIVTPLRAALQALIDGVPAEDEIALVTMGRQLRIRVQPTTDRKRLKDEAGRLFSDGGGTVLLDSLLEANDRILSKAVDRQAAIVILTTDGPESSSSTREEQFNKFVTDLVAKDVIVHAVVMSAGTNITGTNSGLGLNGSPNLAAGGSSGTQYIVSMNLAQNTGGHFDSINAPTALADKMTAVAGEITAEREAMSTWYRVDYQVESSGPGKVIDVEVRRPDVKMELSSGRPGSQASLRSIK